VINVSLQVHAYLKQSMHVVEAMAKAVGVAPVKPECIVLPNTGPEEFCPYYPPIALHPGSSSSGLALRWPTASFAALIDRLLQLHYPVLLLIGPAEPDLLKYLRQHLSTPPPPGMFTALKNAPVPELTRRLKQCGCFVGHDTGTSHLAGLLGIPTLALFGLSNPVIFRPLGPTVKVIEKEPLSQLPVEQVLETVLGMYNSHR
jgi:heptosyltransferase III